MVTFQDGLSGAPSENDVIRTQIESLMEIMLVQVQDRVCTETGVLRVPPVGLGEKLKEVVVWGIDCYTRRMVELVIDDEYTAEEDAVCKTGPRVGKKNTVRNQGKQDNESYELHPARVSSIKTFIERRLLPSINAQPSEKAHNMWYAANSIVEDQASSTSDIKMASAIISAIDLCGMEHFKIHPKGTGVICTAPEGIPPHTVVSEYLGELYPPYRWCEKLDIVEQAQKKFGLKPTLPDFYNILLERPRQDPRGYGLLFVDASQKANMGSSCSHSCDSNCTSAVVARDGKLVIVLTTNRFVHPGEELCMDYCSITTSDVEWRAAICLCGMSACRGK